MMNRFYCITVLDDEGNPGVDTLIALDHVLTVDLDLQDIDPEDPLEEKKFFATFTMRDDVSFCLRIDNATNEELYEILLGD